VSTSDVGEVENVGSHEGSIQADDEVQCQMSSQQHTHRVSNDIDITLSNMKVSCDGIV